jgi:hypothetical protein
LITVVVVVVVQTLRLRDQQARTARVVAEAQAFSTVRPGLQTQVAVVVVVGVLLQATAATAAQA